MNNGKILNFKNKHYNFISLIFIVFLLLFNLFFLNFRTDNMSFLRDFNYIDNNNSLLDNDNLSYKEKVLYNQISDAVKKDKDFINTSFFNYSKESVNKVFTAFFFNNPINFNLSKRYDLVYKRGRIARIDLHYLLTREEYEYMLSEVDDVLVYIKKETENMDDMKKAQFVYDYLAQNNIYIKKSPFVNSLYGSMFLNRANCEGFSAGYMYIMNELNIPTVQALGKINTSKGLENHSWNISIINDKTYYIDVTFANKYVDESGKIINNDYFKYFTDNKELTLIDRSITIQENVFGFY